MFNLRFPVLVAFVALSVCHGHEGHHEENHNPSDEVDSKAHISDHRFFLHEIFAKYGHDGRMTFEGFEHLLESLGLGNIIISDHDVSAHKEDSFRSTHYTHDHSKKGVSQSDHPPEGETKMNLQTTPVQGDRTIHVHRHTAAIPKTFKSTTPVRNALRSTLQKTERPTSDPTSPTETWKENVSSTASSSGSIYHYHLPDAEIPELLFNITSLIDQHQELMNEPHEYAVQQCLSPRDILEAFGINQTSNLNPVSFLHLCPAIIYELDQGHCMFRNLGHKPHAGLPALEQWLYTLLAVTVISLCGLLSVAVIPIMQKWFYHTLIQFLVGLAVGSLSGDGLLHLMPHAMLSGDGSHGGDSLIPEMAEKMAVWRGFAALSGILFFFIAERVLAVISVQRRAKKAAQQEDECPKSPEVVVYKDGLVGEKLSQYRKNSLDVDGKANEITQMLAIRHGSVHEIQSPHSEHAHGHSHEVPESISAVAWMVIMGDGLHNFCDGLAIGAAFVSGIEGGISTTVAVFCHELPHELGDFAMLLQTGMSARRALMYNVLSSGLCLAGAAVGLCLGGISSATGWVFAFTAGIFLYVALVDMLPELNSFASSGSNPLYQLAIQVFGIFSGVSIMLVIANYEQDLQSIIS